MNILKLSEDVGIKNIKNFYSEIKSMLDNEPEIMLDFSKVKRIDLAVAQVIFAANKEARKRNKLIKLKAVSEGIRKELHLTGILK